MDLLNSEDIIPTQYSSLLIRINSLNLAIFFSVLGGLRPV